MLKFIVFADAIIAPLPVNEVPELKFVVVTFSRLPPAKFIVPVFVKVPPLL